MSRTRSAPHKRRRLTALIAAACTTIALSLTAVAPHASADTWHAPTDHTIYFDLTGGWNSTDDSFDTANGNFGYISGSTGGNAAGIPGACTYVYHSTTGQVCQRTANPDSALNTTPSDPDFQQPAPDTLDASGVTYPLGGGYAHFNGRARILVPVSAEMNPPAMTTTTPVSWGDSVRLPTGTFGTGAGEYDCSDVGSPPTMTSGGTSCSSYTNGYRIKAHTTDTKANVMQVGLSSGTGSYGVIKQEITATKPSTTVLYGIPSCTIRAIVKSGYPGAGSMADVDQIVNSSVTVDNNAFHDIKCVATDADIKVYVDGTLRGTKTYADKATGATIKLLPPVFNTGVDYMSMGGKRAAKLQVDTHDTLNGDLKNVFVDSGAVPLTPNLVENASSKNNGLGWKDNMFCFDDNSSGHCDLGDRTEFGWGFVNSGKGAFNIAAATIVTPTPLSGASAYFCGGVNGTVAIDGHSDPLGTTNTTGSGYGCNNTDHGGGTYHLVTQAEVDAGVVDAGVASFTGPEVGTTTPNYSVSIVLKGSTYQNPIMTASYSDTTTDVDSSGTVNLGDTVNGTYVVTNTGNVTLTSMSIVGDFAGNTPSCGATTLAPAAMTNCTFTHTITATDVNNGLYQAGGGHAHATNPPSEAGTTDSASASTHTTTISGASSALSITKTVTNTDLNFDSSTDEGDRLVGNYTVTNTGTRTVSGIAVADTKLSNVTCLATTLAGGANTTCTSDPYFIVPADTTAGTIGGGGTATGTDSIGGAVTSNTASTSTTVLAVPGYLTMTRTASVADTNADSVTGDAGDVISYAINYSNTYALNGLNNVQARSYYPAGAGSYTTVSGCPANLTKSGGATPSGSCTETHTITSGDVTAGKVSVWSYVRGILNTIGSTQASNGININTPTFATPVPALQLTKTAPAVDTNSDGVIGDAGDHIVYDFAVKNTGVTTISGIAASDTQDPNTITCSPTSAAGGVTVHCTSSDYVITSGDVTAGSVNGTGTATSTSPVLTSNTSATSTTTRAAPPLNNKVLLIMLENQPRSAITSTSMPFLYDANNGLPYSGTTYQAASLTNYTQVPGVAKKSLPNYLDIAAGYDFGITDDANPAHHPLDASHFPSFTTSTVFDQAIANSKTAKVYADGMQNPNGTTTTCKLFDGSTDGSNLNDLFAVRHGMWGYFDDATPRANCQNFMVSQNVAGSTPLQTDVTNGTLPNVGYLAPNLKHQGHNPYTMGDADAYLASIVPTVMAGSDFTTGHLSIIVTFDEGSAADPTVNFTVFNKNSVAGCSDATTGITHFGLNHWLSSMAGGTGINNGIGATDPRSALTTTCVPGL